MWQLVDVFASGLLPALSRYISELVNKIINRLQAIIQNVRSLVIM